MFLIVFASTARAEDARSILFDGTCSPGSGIKVGSVRADFGQVKAIPLLCAKLTIDVLANGRVLLQFPNLGVYNTGPLGFAGGSIDHVSDTMTTMTVDRIYPRFLVSQTTEGKSLFAEGKCFFTARRLEDAKQITCIAKVEDSGVKTVYSALFSVIKSLKPNVYKPNLFSK